MPTTVEDGASRRSHASRTVRVTCTGSLVRSSLVRSSLVVGLLACGESGSAPPPPVDAVAVSPSSISLDLGAMQALTAVPHHAGRPLTGRTIAWSSSDATVASVSDVGVVLAHRAGTARIVATSEGISGSSDVTVLNPVPVLTALSPTTVPAGSDAFVLTAHGSGFTADSRILWEGVPRPTTFESSTRLSAVISAADVSARGGVPVYVLTTGPGGGRTETLGFSIGPTPVAAVTLTPGALQLAPGEERQLVARAYDARGQLIAGSLFTFRSSAPAIAEVDPGGVVKARAPGVAEIVAESEGTSASIAVSVAAGDRVAPRRPTAMAPPPSDR